MNASLRFLTAALLLIAAGPACAFEFDDPLQFTLANDVAYVPGGGDLQSGQRRQIMDIYRPVGATGLLPVLLLVHGGGWNTSNGSAYIADKDFLATGDYVVATMNYRLNTTVAPMLTQVADVKAAIRYLRANAASFGIDPAKFGLYGNSAGAHLASLAALTDDTDLFGSPTDTANLQNVGVSSEVLFVVDWSAPTLVGGGDFDLAARISPGDPAFKLFHGTNDGTVNISESRNFRNALVAGGIPASLTEISGAAHFPQPSDYTVVAPVFLSFIDAQYAAVPEPGTAVLLLAGVAACVARRRRSPQP